MADEEERTPLQEAGRKVSYSTLSTLQQDACPGTPGHVAGDGGSAVRAKVRRLVIIRHFAAALAERMWEFAVVLLLTLVS
jgi:hypothetical protein